MIALPAVCFALRSVGPATRVVYYAYLPVEELVIFVTSAVLGASLGAQVPSWLRRVTPSAASPRRPILRLVALGLLIGWVVLPQLRAFPASASAADRDVWASARVPQYVSLKRVLRTIPEIQRDVGHIVTIAPTASDQHRYAREMNGDDMFFALDVIGDHGSGVFYVECTLDEYRVYDWRSGRWVANGRELQIKHVSDQVPQT
jgi:hypothetical protein